MSTRVNGQGRSTYGRCCARALSANGCRCCARALSANGCRCCARVLNANSCRCCARALNANSRRCCRGMQRILVRPLHPDGSSASDSSWRTLLHIHPCREITIRRSRIAMHLVCGRPVSNCRVCSIFDQTLHRKAANSVGRLANVGSARFSIRPYISTGAVAEALARVSSGH